MTTMNHFNKRLAIRNLIIVTVLSVAYLLGKHFQPIHNTSTDRDLKVTYTKYK